jgi:hypothetical protein
MWLARDIRQNFRLSTIPRMVETKAGRGERIRTSGPCLPKTVLYQAELLPDRNPQTT